MSNLMIAPQPAPANAESPKLNSGHVLPADVKTAGKKSEALKAEAESASEEFSASLKAGLEKEAKKGESKKGVATALLNAQTPVVTLDPKTGKPVQDAQEEKSAKSVKDLTAKTQPKSQLDVQSKGEKQAIAIPVAGLSTQTLADQAALFANSAKTPQAETQIKTNLDETAKTPAKLQSKAIAIGAQTLSPLQEMMLAQSELSRPETLKGAKAKAELAQNLKAAEGTEPEFSHAFEIESLGVGTTGSKEKLFSDLAQASEKRAPSSKVSTSDFLSLRDLTKQNTVNPFGQASSQSHLDLGTAVKSKDGKKDKLESLGGKEMLAGSFSSRLENQLNAKAMDATVTTGSAGKTVMTHDAIHEMTKQVNLLSQARQDGEIKIRLRPDHLGELHMSVKTQGQQVTIEIKAQNNESKKIIEESLASLKDSLAGQSLTLARVDVVSVATHSQAAADQGTQFDMSQFRQNSGQQNSGREFEQGSNQKPYYEELNGPVNLSSVRRPNQGAREARQGLDLIA